MMYLLIQYIPKQTKNWDCISHELFLHVAQIKLKVPKTLELLRDWASVAAC